MAAYQEKTEENANNNSVVGPGTQMPTQTTSQDQNQQQAGFVGQVANSGGGGQPPQQFTTQQSAPQAPKPKRNISKKLLLIVPFLLLLSLFVYLLIQLKQGGFGGGPLGKKGEIVWWGFWDKATVEPLIEKYTDENPGVKISYVSQSKSDYRERLQNSLAKGEGPDIFHFHNSWVPMFSDDLEPAQASVMSAQEFTDNYYPVIRDDLLVNSGVLGVPLTYDAITLFVNEDLLAAAGKTAPVTWDEFKLLADDLTTKDKDGRIIQSGAAIGRTENIDHWPEILGLMMLQNGVNPANPTGQLAEDAVKFYTVFAIEDNKIWDETLPPSTIAFANGKVAMYFGPSSRAQDISKLNPTLRYKTVPLPQLRKDDPNEPDLSYATYWAEGVWNKSVNKETAWEFLSFLSQREQLMDLHKNIALNQSVGEPYPRIDMGNLLFDDKVLGSVVVLAPEAKSWYLAGETNDGETGINSQLSALFKQVIDNVLVGKLPSKELNTIAPDVAKVLSQYGIKVKSGLGI